jgi:hypothetical protein
MAFQPVYPQLGAPSMPSASIPVSASDNNSLYNMMAVASMAAVTLYVLMQTAFAIIDRFQQLWHGRRTPTPVQQPPPPPVAVDNGAGVGVANIADTPAVTSDDADFIAAALQALVWWPALSAAWQAYPSKQRVLHLFKLLPNILVVLIALLLTYWLAGALLSTGADSLMDNEVDKVPDTLRLEYYAGVPYVLGTFGTGAHGHPQKMPIVDCAQFHEALRVQDKLLGPAPVNTASGAAGSVADPSYQQRLERERAYLGELRTKASRRCLLHSIEDDAIGSNEQMWIKRAQWAARVAPMRQSDGRVGEILVARNGTRYLRLMMAPIPSSGTGGGTVLPEPVVVTDTWLLAAVEQWHARFLALARRNLLVYPCICPAHLGIVNSGMHFYYDYEAPDNAGLDKAQRGRWHLLLDVQVAAFGGNAAAASVGKVEVDMSGLYREYMTSFPLAADEAWNGTIVAHPEISSVSYVNPAAAGIAAAYDRIEPMWVAPNAPVSPFATVMPLKTLAAHERLGSVVHMTNACFYHCRALEPSRAP